MSQASMEDMKYGEGIQLAQSLVQSSIAQIRANALQPFRDDITEWLQLWLDSNVCSKNFLDHIDNGIILCQIFQEIERKAQTLHPCEMPREGMKKVIIPMYTRTQRGTWYARENINHFLNWCRVYGINRDIICDCSDIEDHVSERKILLTLLEVSKIARRHGLPSCELTRLEEQINYRMTDVDSRNFFGPLKFYRETNPFQVDLSKWDVDPVVNQVVQTMGKGLHIEKLDNQVYNISGRLVHVKLLRKKYLMTYDDKLLGKWDTLQNYIANRNPACLCM